MKIKDLKKLTEIFITPPFKQGAFLSFVTDDMRNAKALPDIMVVNGRDIEVVFCTEGQRYYFLLRENNQILLILVCDVVENTPNLIHIVGVERDKTLNSARLLIYLFDYLIFKFGVGIVSDSVLTADALKFWQNLKLKNIVHIYDNNDQVIYSLADIGEKTPDGVTIIDPKDDTDLLKIEKDKLKYRFLYLAKA